MRLRSISMPAEFAGLGKNFMTPNVIGYYRTKAGAVELSEGRGMQHQPIFGVTVKRFEGEGVDRKVVDGGSKMFQSRPLAEMYIEDDLNGFA